MFPLSTILDFDIWFGIFIKDFEREVLDIGLNLSIFESATDETLGVENTVKKTIGVNQNRRRRTDKARIRVMWVHGNLILRGITDQPLVVAESDVRRRRPVTLVIRDDLNAIILPDTDAAASKIGHARLTFVDIDKTHE
jgi:hypothetical protein